ncbi:unnamed protein product, partial [Rotaria socialis]
RELVPLDYTEINSMSYLQGTEIVQASISDHDQQTINENEEQDDQSEDDEQI